MCTRPITLRNPDPDQVLGFGITVPCGQCPECLAKRQNDWKLRLMEESKNYTYMYFFTLTYSDDNLPLTDEGLSTACKREVQLWIKRFRMAFERSKGIKLSDYMKYFICAEYGPNGTHRPHYHGLIMTDLDEVAISPLFNEWRREKGFVDLQSVPINPDERQAVSNYVSKYCCKGEFSSRQDDIAAGKIEKAWSIMSKGIGESYVKNPVNRRFHRPLMRGCSLLERLDTIIERMKVTFVTPSQSFSYSMPRYYRERLFQKKQPFERIVYNPRKKIYEKKTVWRYSPKGTIAHPLSVRIRDRVLDRFAEMLGYSRWVFVPPELAQSLNISVPSESAADLAFRESSKRSKLADFYLTNANRWRHL